MDANIKVYKDRTVSIKTSLKNLFAEDLIIPVKFHPYTSLVREILFWEEIPQGEYLDYERKLLQIFTMAGIPAQIDNKTVFECTIFGSTICFGFKDWAFCIGTSYIDENESRQEKIDERNKSILRRSNYGLNKKSSNLCYSCS